jgi:NAD+ synthase (glutamine-hydrolysing)
LLPVIICENGLLTKKNFGKNLKFVSLNLAPETVKWVLQAVDRSEHKRRQAPPGLKVTTKAFGLGRRMPIAAKYEI